MQVIDPGHEYELDNYDCVATNKHRLVFMKREGEGYPGNIGHHSGTNLQEVLRACINRVQYLENQIPHAANDMALRGLRSALYALEYRAAQRHKRTLNLENGLDDIELLPTCPKCGHIGCEGHQ